ncbi:MAG: hypothetical protein ABH828_03420 [archaeon]
MGIFDRLKNKDKFLHQPNSIPETAKDMYGDISRPIKKEKEEKKEEPPKDLPGEGESSVNEFVDKEINVDEEKTTEVSSIEEQKETTIKDEHIKEPPALKESLELEPFDNNQYDEADEADDEDNEDDGEEEKSELIINSIPESKKKEIPAEEGFFKDFKNFLENKNLSGEFVSELLDKDLLSKMRQFHTQREDGMPFFFHSSDSDRELAKKLAELQTLEEEWYIRHRTLKESEFLVLEKEAEIDMHLEELKSILKHIKQREKLEKKANKNNYFHLADGQVLRSIGDLRESLKTMKDSLFEHHVSNDRNDFALWVNHVFGESELAEQIRSASTRRGLLKVLYEF